MAATFADAKMTRLASECSLPESVIKWLNTQGVTACQKMAMAATSEEAVTKLMIEPMVSANLDGMQLLGTQASIQLFWHACRDDWKGERKSMDGRNVEEDAPIPEKAEIKLTEQWKKRHNFVLPDAQLLTAYQQGKVWRDLQLSPPQIDKWFAMKLRTMGEGNPKRTGTTMTFVQGKPVEQLEVVLDTVEDKMEL